MKKLFFALIITIMVVGCDQAAKQESTTPGNSDEMKALYEANLATLKTAVTAFENEDINAYSAQIADSAVWASPVYGDTITTKAHWISSLKNLMDNWSNLHLTNGQFLPGIDSTTHAFDGSVRYYGIWNGTYSSGKTTMVKFYGTYEFNKDHKIIYGSDFYDVGGLLNAVKPQ